MRPCTGSRALAAAPRSWRSCAAASAGPAGLAGPLGPVVPRTTSWWPSPGRPARAPPTRPPSPPEPRPDGTKVPGRAAEGTTRDGWTNACSNRILELVASPQRLLIPGDPQDRWLQLTWRFLGGSFGLLAGVAILALLIGDAKPLGLIVVALVALVAGAAWLHRRAVLALDTSRRTEAESFARILQGLARSVSPATVVEAMVGDLGRVTAADHCVVVHLEGDSGALVATLVSMRPGVRSTTSVLPPLDLEVAAGDDPERVVERLAASVEAFFGIGNTLTVPLRHGRAVIGAIVLSRRSLEPWPAATQRVLAGAALEAAAALERVDSSRAMEAQASTDVLTGLPNRRYFDE